jgi:hypothetical protein
MTCSLSLISKYFLLSFLRVPCSVRLQGHHSEHKPQSLTSCNCRQMGVRDITQITTHGNLQLRSWKSKVLRAVGGVHRGTWSSVGSAEGFPTADLHTDAQSMRTEIREEPGSFNPFTGYLLSPKVSTLGKTWWLLPNSPLFSGDSWCENLKGAVQLPMGAKGKKCVTWGPSRRTSLGSDHREMARLCWLTPLLIRTPIPSSHLLALLVFWWLC